MLHHSFAIYHSSRPSYRVHQFCPHGFLRIHALASITPIPSNFGLPKWISCKGRKLKFTRSRKVQCQGWFEFNSDGSDQVPPKLSIGDFQILSHLKQLGCGEVMCKPQVVHFRGCINESYSFDCTGGKFFVKINRTFNAESMFAGEYEALQKLNAFHAIRVPRPLGFGDLPDSGSYIILEHLQFRPFGIMRKGSQEMLGRDLARLHLSEAGAGFGFPVTTRLGALPLDNEWTSSWTTFFVEKRLQERLQRVYAALGYQATDLWLKGDRVLKRASDILDTHDPKPRMLHGDLWMGNTGLVSTNEVVIFDPASFIGDAEFDLAFRDWPPDQGFPGFSDTFYESYHELLPRAPGFEDRHNVYQLFHLLNHLLIYGNEYYNHVVHIMDKLI